MRSIFKAGDTVQRHKRSYLFLICSLIVHLLTLLILSRLWYEQYQTPPVHDEIVIDITHSPRPEVQPRERRKSPAPPLTAKTIEVVKKSHPPKPKLTPDSDWSVEHSFSRSNRRETITAKQERSANFNRLLLNPQSHLSKTAHPKSQAIATEIAPLQPTNSEVVTPLSGNENISMSESGRDLNTNSPEFGPVEMRYWHTKGSVFSEAPVGNTSGGGAMGRPHGNYIQMMTDLAQDIAEVATTSEIDLVFIVDKTGSMEDNVRGIRAYTDLLFEHLAWMGHDTAVGLVTFADATEEKPKARGVTDDHSKFKNWLYKIDFKGGGDLLESGLDALMTAVHEIKFRTGGQRFFVFASDGAFHDADYDGKSEYSLDQVIEALQRERIRVNVLGLDYLPVKQIAWGTQGVWRAIPGKGYLEYVPPITMTAKMLSEFGVLGFNEHSLADELVVYVNRNPRPKWLKVSWKILNPLGERCYGPFADQEVISNDDSEVVTLSPTVNVSQFATMTGTYTIIYHLENDLGHQSILRRAFDMP